MTATPKMRQNKGSQSHKTVSPELMKFMEEECKPVRGIFKNYECPGGSLPVCQSKYPNQPMFNQIMVDGQEYEVPLWVARYLNGIDVTAKSCNGRIGSCSYPRYEYQLPQGSLDGGIAAGPVPMIGQRRQRFGFQSMDFLV